jgi:hypothetical protein
MGSGVEALRSAGNVDIKDRMELYSNRFVHAVVRT